MATDVVLGETFGLLFDLVKQNIVNVVKFKPTLNKIKSNLISLEPVIQDITKLKMELDQTGCMTESLESLMKEGVELVGRCLKVKKWMLWKKRKYCYKLQEFNYRLEGKIKVLSVEIARDVKQNLWHVREVERYVKESLEIVRDLSRLRNEKETSMVIRVPLTKSDETFGLVQEMGLDTPLEELKTRLLEGGISILLLITALGCWKFCHDDRVKGIHIQLQIQEFYATEIIKMILLFP